MEKLFGDKNSPLQIDLASSNKLQHLPITRTVAQKCTAYSGNFTQPLRITPYK